MWDLISDVSESSSFLKYRTQGNRKDHRKHVLDCLSESICCLKESLSLLSVLNKDLEKEIRKEAC